MRIDNQWKRWTLAAALSLGLALGGVAARADGVDPWVYAHAGLDHFYNLEYDEAIADLQKALEGDPDNVLFHNYLTNVFLFQELYRTRRLEGNLYAASNAFLKAQKPKPDPERMALIRQRVATVKQLCQQRLQENRYDTEALYAQGVAYSIEANYKFTLEKKYLDALRAASKANQLHRQVLKLDPNYHDAKLVPGLYQYVVGSLPGGIKFLVFLIGHRGNKSRGIALLQDAIANGQQVSSGAAILLGVVYNREKKHAYARQLYETLSQYYPRNLLLRLEVGRTYEREGNRAAALEVYTQVVEQVEAGVPGYSKVPRERLYYQIGIMHLQVGELDRALSAFFHVGEREEGDGLVKAFSALRRGEIYIAQKQPERARAEFERVAAMPYEEPRRLAQQRLRALSR